MRNALLLSTISFLAACASSPPPPPVMVAADRGQPKMQAAQAALQQAAAEVQAAAPNKGGHREQALRLIEQACAAVAAGVQYAAAHPTELSAPEGPAAPEPVDELVPGAERQPHMARAVVALREARRQLVEAKHDKGGFRVQGLALIEQALAQLREGIRFANMN
jgi:hypothetical protein